MVFNFYLLIIVTKKTLWGDVNKVLYCKTCQSYTFFFLWLHFVQEKDKFVK